MKIKTLAIIAGLTFAPIQIQASQETTDADKLILRAHQLIENQNFNGAILCSVSTSRLGYSAESDLHIANIFQSGHQLGYNQTEIVVASAISTTSIHARMNAYTDGLIDGLKQHTPSLQLTPQIKRQFDQKRLLGWYKENRCKSGSQTGKYPSP